MIRIILFLLLILPTKLLAYECNKEIDNISEKYQIPIFCKKSSLIGLLPIKYFDEVDKKLLEQTTPTFTAFFGSYEKKFLKNFHYLV